MPLETEADFLHRIQEMALVGRAILGLELDDYIAKMERSLALTPFIDPTLWMQGHRKGELCLKLARTLKKAQTDLAELRELIGLEGH